jgi:hypothetical protein
VTLTEFPVSHLLQATHQGTVLSELWLRLEETSDASEYTHASGCAAELADLLRVALPHGPQRLRVGTSLHHSASYGPVVDVLLRMRPPVEFLALGDFVYPDKRGSYVPDDTDKDGASWSTEITLPEEFWPAMSDLRELVVHSDDLWTEKIRSPSLTRLAIRCRALDPYVAAELGTAELPALERLDLWIGDYAYQWDGAIADLAPLLAADGIPALRHLRCCADIADDLVEALCDSPLLRRLETLDLSTGGLTDRGAASLAAHRAAFAHLAWLNLDGNSLSTVGRALVEDVAESVYLGSQRPDAGALIDPRPTLLG